MDYAAFVAYVKSLKGVPTAWPFKDDPEHQGLPAALFTAQAYTDAFNAGQIDVAMTQRATADNAHFYVLMPGVVGSPHTLTVAERIKNSLYLAGDTTADVLGLPPLTELETAAQVLVASVVVVVIVIGVLVYKNSHKGR